MDLKYPIFTKKNECQDCYKCIRECPVKSILVNDHNASIISDLCTCCGHCYKVCPAQAKDIRSDISRCQYLIASGQKVAISLAPSWPCEFPSYTFNDISAALKKLGVVFVEETAHGADIVSEHVEQFLSEKKGLSISSACPAVVEWIRKYKPDFTSALTPIASPAAVHSREIKESCDDDVHVVFVGPCIAKKLEADHKAGMDVSLTFRELREWLDDSNIRISETGKSNDPEDIATQRLGMGHLYPVEGGMNKSFLHTPDTEVISVSGLDNLKKSLQSLSPNQTGSLFIEALACEGGCISGPGMTNSNRSLDNYLSILGVKPEQDNTTQPEETIPELYRMSWEQSAPPNETFTVTDIRKSLNRIGKYSPTDELNCSGCGYDTCRSFASALLEHKAEPPMCVSFMRKKAQKKANALLRSIPSAVVIVNENLKIIECNQPFAILLGHEIEGIYSMFKNLSGMDIKKSLPFANLFELALQTNEEVRRPNMQVKGRLCNVTIFQIEKGSTIGAVIQDVTNTEMHRSKIAKSAREVLQKNMVTVQDIACKLGEHMADTEILLNAIANQYSECRDEGNQWVIEE